MADTFAVTFENLDQVIRRYDNLRLNIPRLVAAAANSTGKRAKTLVARDVMERWNLKAKKTVLDTMTLVPATQARPVAEVRMVSPGVPFSKFKMTRVAISLKTKPKLQVRIRNGKITRQMLSRKYKRYGVKVALLKTDTPDVVPHAFPATVRSGHYGAFQRKGNPRLPIFEKKSVSTVSMWRKFLDQHLRELTPYLRDRVIGQLEAMAARRSQ